MKNEKVQKKIEDRIKEIYDKKLENLKNIAN